jgi:hypothetical protein
LFSCPRGPIILQKSKRGIALWQRVPHEAIEWILAAIVVVFRPT